MAKMSASSPCLVYSDGNGHVSELADYDALGISGNSLKQISSAEWIQLPEGSQLMELPGRLPVGRNRHNGAVEVIGSDGDETVWAVAAFVAPAYTICYHAAWETQSRAPRLPLYAYCAVGWQEGRFYVPALRVDPDPRQDPARVDFEQLPAAADRLLARYPDNRLARHLVQNCALTYCCPAAINYLFNRWEMPLPSSQSCNADCIGCISMQKNSGVCSAQFRIGITPTAAEITELAVDHLEKAPRPIVSFGQGCEGEPLMNLQLLIEAIRGVRKRTLKGTINLNTNASRPAAVAALREVGLDSIRVSLNSARKQFYDRYFRPRDYRFEDVFDSIGVMKQKNGFVSLNLFVFPGFSDQPAEIEALEKLIREWEIDMIQWRNLNIDPEWYWEIIDPIEEEGIGIPKTIEHFRRTFLNLRHGYFNPYL